MGNRAIITTPERKVGLYVHWNGGRDTIEPLLRYCELKGYRDPAKDDYGWARMAQVLGNFFDGTNWFGNSGVTIAGPRYTTQTLIDAKVHPEDHDGMLVRVAGYTAYFTELGGEVQDDIISRSSHSKID